MAWFSREIVSLTPEEIRPEPPKLIGIDPNKTAMVIENSLDAARDRLTELVAEELRIQSEAAKTRLSIAALEAAGQVFNTADPDFAEIDVDRLTGPAPLEKRLVPRAAGPAS